PRQRRSLRDELQGPDARKRAAVLLPLDLRVGDLRRPDRPDDLPLRAHRSPDAGAREGRTRRGALSGTTLDAWVGGAAYLRPLARFRAEAETAAGEVETPRVSIPRWEDYAADFAEGIALLQSPGAGVDLEPGGRMAVDLVGRLSARSAAGSAIAGL